MCCVICLQRPLQLFPHVRRMSSCVPMAGASAPLCAVTSLTTVRTMAPMRPTARQVPHVRMDFYITANHRSEVSNIKPQQNLLNPPLTCSCSRSDTKLNDCRSNRTQCGDGDEAHCVTNRTDSFCSCKPGFQKIGHHTCGGTHTRLDFCSGRRGAWL